MLYKKTGVTGATSTSVTYKGNASKLCICNTLCMLMYVTNSLI